MLTPKGIWRVSMRFIPSYKRVNKTNALQTLQRQIRAKAIQP